MFKCKNVVKSSKVAQVNNVVSVTGNSGTYVEMGVATHNQYNSEVSMLNYTKDTKYQKYTINNIALFNATDESLANTSFETIGEEPIIGHCITTEDLINIYANGCIQQFYEEYCKLHSHKENLILGKLLSILGIEVWRDVTCYGGIYKGKYMVSNLGRVLRLYKTKDFTRILKQFVCGNGYLYVWLYHKGHKQTVRVNRLVGLTFIEEPTEPLDCCHSNTNKLDNRLFNLEFKTHAENLQNPITLKKCKESAIVAKAKSKADKATTATSTPTTSE